MSRQSPDGLRLRLTGVAGSIAETYDAGFVAPAEDPAGATEALRVLMLKDLDAARQGDDAATLVYASLSLAAAAIAHAGVILRLIAEATAEDTGETPAEVLGDLVGHLEDGAAHAAGRYQTGT